MKGIGKNPPADAHAVRRAEMRKELMDAYVGWRQACATLDDVYVQWGQARAQERAEAYERCAAALDEEGRAAAWYGAVTRRVEQAIDALESTGTQRGSSARPAGSP